MIRLAQTLLIPALLGLAAQAAAAQVSAPHPEGVHLDGEGVLSSKRREPDPRLKELRRRARGKKEEGGGLCYISLPRLFKKAREHIKAGEKLPAKIRYLGGMVRLQYIFIYPEDGDLVIAGPAEPFDPDVVYRPLGKRTGRPVLQLDDLVTALRSSGPGKSPFRVGCDILITKEIAERVDKKVAEVTQKLREISPREAADRIAEAGGTQPVKYYGVPANTRFAFVCVEADFRLKELGLDLFESPVRKVRSYFSLLRRPERHHRFSLESHYDAIAVSPEGNAYELRGPSLKVNSGLLRVDGRMAKGTKISRAAKRFKDQCNKYFDELCESLVSWADLQNLGDLTVLAALIGKDELHKKVKWNLSWILDPDGYPVGTMKTPRSAKVLCNYRHAGGMLLFTSGGVGLFPTQWVKKTTVDEEGGVSEKARRPDEEIWIPTRSAKDEKEEGK